MMGNLAAAATWAMIVIFAVLWIVDEERRGKR